MLDHGAPDHKIIAVLVQDPIYAERTTVKDFPGHIFKMLRRFFEDYKTLEGKEVEVDELKPAEAAHKIIEDSLARYSKARRTGILTGLR
jgi:inorganic pyrophosphatase